MKNQTPLVKHGFVQSVDCNPQSLIKISAIARYFQEAAWEHAENMGLGYNALIKNEQVWVLYSQKFSIRKYPVWKDNIAIKTWGKSFENLFALRDFYLWIEGDDDPAISATSTWIILSTKNHRPVRLSQYADTVSPIAENAIKEKAGNIEVPEYFSGEYSLRVRYSDIDIYNHTNNASYFDFCIDSIPELRSFMKRINEVNIRYVNESVLDDNIIIRYLKKNNKFIVDGMKSDSGKEVFRASFDYS